MVDDSQEDDSAIRQWILDQASRPAPTPLAPGMNAHVPVNQPLSFDALDKSSAPPVVAPPAPVTPVQAAASTALGHVAKLRTSAPAGIPDVSNAYTSNDWARLSPNQREQGLVKLEQDSLSGRQGRETNVHDLANTQEQARIDESKAQLAQDKANRESSLAYDEKQNLEREADTHAQEDALAKYNNAIEEMRNFHIDPDRYQKNLNPGQNLLWAIGAGLSALGGSANGGQNSAVQLMNDRINKDIAAQEKDLEGKKDTVVARHNFMGALRAHLQDKDAARAAFRTAYLQHGINQLENLKGDATTTEQVRKLDMLQAAFKADQEQAKADLSDNLVKNGYANFAAKQRAAAGSQATAQKKLEAANKQAIEDTDKALKDKTISAADAAAFRKERLGEYLGAAGGAVARTSPDSGKSKDLKGQDRNIFNSSQVVTQSAKDIEKNYKGAGIDWSQPAPYINAKLYAWAALHPTDAAQMKVDLQVMAKEGQRALTGTAPDVNTLHEIDHMSLGDLVRHNITHVNGAKARIQALETRYANGIPSPEPELEEGEAQ